MCEEAALAPAGVVPTLQDHHRLDGGGLLGGLDEVVAGVDALEVADDDLGLLVLGEGREEVGLR